LLKKSAKINLEIIKIRGADEKYIGAPALKQMYNDIKAYVGREKEENKLL